MVYLILIFLIGVALRIIYLITPDIDSDTAILGLMARHILDGEFPIFYWGEHYCGPIESYLAAIIFYLFGSSRLTLSLSPFIFSLIFIYLVYQLAKEMFNEKVARIGMLLAAVSPPFLIWYSTLARGNYIQNLVVGTLLLLMILRFMKLSDEKAVKRYYIIIGFTAGLAWWVNFQIIPFLLTAFIFMLLKERWRFIKRGILYGLPSFMIGSFLFWYYNLKNSWASILDIERYSEVLKLSDSLSLFFDFKLPYVLGPFSETEMGFLNRYFLFIYGAALLYLILSHRKEILGLFRLSVKRMKGAEILFVFVIIFSAIIISQYNSGTTTRYYLPLYSVFPIIVAGFIYNTRRIFKALPVLLIILFVSSNIYGDIKGALISDPERLKNYKERREWELALFDLLEEKGLRYVTETDYWKSYRLTFDASERVIFTFPTLDWRNNKYPRYTEALNSFSNPAYMWPPNSGKNFEMILKAQGIDYTVENFRNHLFIFHSLRMPLRNERCLPASHFRVSSNYNEVDPQMAIDRDVTTVWFPTKPKVEKVYFEIDMKMPYLINKVSILNGGSFDNNPKGYELEVSMDKKRWVKVISLPALLGGFVEKNGIPVLEGGYLISVFDPVWARHIRIKQGEGPPSMSWHISEIFIYSPLGPMVEVNKNPSYLLGLKYYEEKRWEDAMKEFLSAAKGNPDSEDSQYYLWLTTKSLFEIKRMDELSYSSVFLNRLAGLYERIGEVEKAGLFRKRIDEGFSPAEKRSINFGGMIEFLGYDIKYGSIPEIVYYWKAIGRIKKDWTVFVHFLGPDGKIAFQNDHLLFSGGEPSSKWIRGELYKERLRVEVPKDLQSGTYLIKIGLWDPRTGKRLKIKTDLPKRMDEITIGEFRVRE